MDLKTARDVELRIELVRRCREVSIWARISGLPFVADQQIKRANRIARGGTIGKFERLAALERLRKANQ